MIRKYSIKLPLALLIVGALSGCEQAPIKVQRFPGYLEVTGLAKETTITNATLNQGDCAPPMKLRRMRPGEFEEIRARTRPSFSDDEIRAMFGPTTVERGETVTVLAVTCKHVTELQMETSSGDLVLTWSE